jgi:hypothetical protein
MTYYNFATPTSIERLLLENRSYLGLNNNAYLFPKNKVGALNPDGSVVLADCADPAKQNIAGICHEDIISGEKGYFLQLETATDAIDGLGAQAGDIIYLSTVAGEMTLTPPSGPGEAVIRLGIAEANPNTNLITDLRIDISVEIDAGGTGGGTTPSEVQDIVDASRETEGENLSGTNIQAFKAVAWENAGTIVAGDATMASRCDVIGITTTAISSGSFGTVRTEGIVPNAVASLGAQAGQEVFLAEGAGGNLTLTAPTAVTSGVIKVGVAVPPTGSTGAATDLLIQIDRIATP